MKTYTMFNYDMLFSDHMAQVSNQAKLFYIKLNFYANNGFVANPLSVLDSLGFDKSVLQELINNDEVLTIEGRSEIFITSYFVHNKGLKPKSWLSSPFAQYWKYKLWTKDNGVATLKPQESLEQPIDTVVNVEPITDEMINDRTKWDDMFEDNKIEESDDDDLPF